MSFETSQPDTEIKLDPIEVQNKTFATAWKGYKVEEVRAYLAKLALAVRELNSELVGIKNRLYEIEHLENASNQDDFKRITKAEETATQIIHDATEAAKALRTQGEQYFEATRKRAEAEASALIEAAKREAESTGGTVGSQPASTEFEIAARRELDTARQKAAEIIEKSKSEGRAMIDQARDLRNEILADLRHKRSVLDGEIAELATRRIEAYQSLSRAVQLISEAGSIVAASEVDAGPNEKAVEGSSSESMAGEVLEQQIQGSGGNDQESETGKTKPSRPIAEVPAIAMGKSEIEIGSHLEEGILRVFSKEDQALSARDVKHEATSKSDPAPSEPVIQASKDDGVVLPEAGAEASSQSHGVTDSPEPGELPDVIELQSMDPTSPPGDVVTSHGASQDEIYSQGDVGQTEPAGPRDGNNEEVHQNSFGDLDDTLTVEEFQNDDTSISVEMANDRLVSPLEPELEAQTIEEDAAAQNVNPLADSGTSPTKMPPNSINQLPEAGSKRGERSKRADEILARIRSLRLGESESGSPTSDKYVADSQHNAAANAPVDEQSEFSNSEESDSEISRVQIHDENTGVEWDPAGSQARLPVDAATEELLSVREEILAPVASMFFRKAKRLLADEQNELLDKVRRSSGNKVSLDELLDEKVQMDAIAIASLDFFEQVRLGVVELFSDGVSQVSRREISQHAVVYSEEFAKELVLPLRRKIEEILGEDSAVEDQTTVSVIGSIYRDMRSNRLEALISQYVNTVFCATVLKESGYESFVWATDPEDTPCADCLDNSLAGATAAGDQFPTGHHHPAIHSGCRCLLVPFIA